MESETLRDIALTYSECLIEKSKKGDNKAFGKLVGLWYKRIYNFSLKYFNDHDQAMEATQRTFISVYFKASCFGQALFRRTSQRLLNSTHQLGSWRDKQIERASPEGIHGQARSPIYQHSAESYPF